jgi:hypothetical protein
MHAYILDRIHYRIVSLTFLQVDMQDRVIHYCIVLQTYPCTHTFGAASSPIASSGRHIRACIHSRPHYPLLHCLVDIFMHAYILDRVHYHIVSQTYSCMQTFRTASSTITLSRRHIHARIYFGPHPLFTLSRRHIHARIYFGPRPLSYCLTDVFLHADIQDRVVHYHIVS